MTEQKKIYLDYAASTPLATEVLKSMQPYLTKFYGNSSGLHDFAIDMRKALDDSRQIFANGLNVKPSEIVFTSSATEANNLALKGIAETYAEKGKHIIISAVEHASVYETAKYLENQGFEISLAPVDEKGYVILEELKKLIRTDTILVSVILVNNETGIIQPIEEIGQICKDAGVLFHTDAVQAFAKIPIDIQASSIDLLSASAHKIYGPLGAGLLFIKSGIKIQPLLHGGGHEENRRSSTVNVPAIVGFASAFQIMNAARDSEWQRISELKKQFISQLEKSLSKFSINGAAETGSPYLLNISFKGCDAEILAMQLNRLGIAVSTGSACGLGKIKISRVLQACHLDKSSLRSAIRFSFGKETSLQQLDYVAQTLSEIVPKVRRIS